MSSLGALQPDAAAMFQEAFDEAIGIDTGKELENIWRMLEPVLSTRGIPLRHLPWAYKLAHGLLLPPVDFQAEHGRKKKNSNEPYPRQAIANYLEFQMMYVSGETAEPSVETTGIIEDIVRQQVIEIVSFPSTSRRFNRFLTIVPAQKLHRTSRPARIARHHD